MFVGPWLCIGGYYNDVCQLMALRSHSSILSYFSIVGFGPEYDYYAGIGPQVSMAMGTEKPLVRNFNETQHIAVVIVR